MSAFEKDGIVFRGMVKERVGGDGAYAIRCNGCGWSIGGHAYEVERETRDLEASVVFHADRCPKLTISQ